MHYKCSIFSPFLCLYATVSRLNILYISLLVLLFPNFIFYKLNIKNQLRTLLLELSNYLSYRRYTFRPMWDITK